MNILLFLSNKKTTITAILAAIIVFCLGRGFLSQDLAQLFTEIMVALGLTVNVAGAAFLTKPKILK